MKIYLAGYTGRKPEQLKQLSDALNVTVVDIRLSPRSRIPYWEKSALQSLLGAKYIWVKELGNVNYKGGPIQILDIGNGMDRAVGYCSFQKSNMLCLCACKDVNSCHRFVVGNGFAATGHEVKEVDWSIISQPVLF